MNASIIFSSFKEMLLNSVVIRAMTNNLAAHLQLCYVPLAKHYGQNESSCSVF